MRKSNQVTLERSAMIHRVWRKNWFQTLGAILFLVGVVYCGPQSSGIQGGKDVGADGDTQESPPTPVFRDIRIQTVGLVDPEEVQEFFAMLDDSADLGSVDLSFGISGYQLLTDAAASAPLSEEEFSEVQLVPIFGGTEGYQTIIGETSASLEELSSIVLNITSVYLTLTDSSGRESVLTASVSFSLVIDVRDLPDEIVGGDGDSSPVSFSAGILAMPWIRAAASLAGQIAGGAAPDSGEVGRVFEETFPTSLAAGITETEEPHPSDFGRTTAEVNRNKGEDGNDEAENEEEEKDENEEEEEKKDEGEGAGAREDLGNEGENGSGNSDGSGNGSGNNPGEGPSQGRSRGRGPG
jgi:hypothetical protein